MENWANGLALIALTVMIHSAGVTAMALAGLRLRDRIDHNRHGLLFLFAYLSVLLGVTGLLLGALHGIEAALWAVAYVRLGAIGSYESALLYSLESMTTLGASAIDLEPKWRTLGALEGADGMLLFGISTAFVFAIMHANWPQISGQPRGRTDAKPEATAARQPDAA